METKLDLQMFEKFIYLLFFIMTSDCRDVFSLAIPYSLYTQKPFRMCFFNFYLYAINVYLFNFSTYMKAVS